MPNGLKLAISDKKRCRGLYETPTGPNLALLPLLKLKTPWRQTMCIFCDEKDLRDGISIKWNSIKLLGDIKLLIGMVLHRIDDNSVNLKSDVFLYDNVIIDNALEINFCPMCGRELNVDKG